MSSKKNRSQGFHQPKNPKTIMESLRKNISPVLSIVILALAIRLICAFIFFGTEDIVGYCQLNKELLNHHNPYLTTTILRWPPVLMFVVKISSVFAGYFNLPFHKVVKLPLVMFDVFICIALFYLGGRLNGGNKKGIWFALVYALNPIAIIISSIHANTDSILVFFLLLSYIIFIGKGEKKFIYSALCLSISVMTKTWPIIMLPIFLLKTKEWKNRFEYAVFTIVPVILSVATLWCIYPQRMYEMMFLYRSSPG